MMGNITSIVNAWAEQQWDKPNWTMSDDGARASLAFTSSTKNDFTYRAFCDVDEDNEVVEIYLYAPVTVPIDKRHLVADAVARINIHLFFGRIDLNMDDGVLRFRAGIDAHTATITAESLKQLLDKGNSTLDKYLPAISGF